MMEDLEPLDADVQALLASEKPIEELSSDRKAALFAAACAQIGSSSSGGSGGESGGSGGSGSGGEGFFAKIASSTALHGARGLVALATTFALGIGTGVAVDRSLTRDGGSAPATTIAGPVKEAPTDLPVSSDRSSPADPNVPTISVESLPRAAPSAQALKTDPSSSPQPATPHEPVASSQGLAAERALLDVARGALASGDPETALSATDRHAKAYANGQLSEERETIAIKALAALGRTDDARTRARAFERRYPNSLMLRAVHAAAFGAP